MTGQTWTTSHAQVAGIPWAYRERGAGPAVVFLHGTLSNSHAFDPQLEALTDDFRCIAIDWPGHARSGFAPGGWTVGDLVEGLAEFLATLDLDRAALVGLSQGGAVALRVALAHPELVTALVIIGAGPDGPSAEVAEGLAELGRTLATQTHPERLASLAPVQTAFHAPGWAARQPELARAELASMAGHPTDAYPLLTQIPGQYDNVLDQLPLIATPTLILWGEHDARRTWGGPMAAGIPQAELVVIPGAGHHSTLDAPSAVTAAVSDFLRAQLLPPPHPDLPRS